MPNKDLRKWAVGVRLILTEETLSHLPIPTFGGADALNDTSGFEVGKMLLDGFGRDAYLYCKSSGTQRSIFCQQGNDFLPTFCSFLPTFLC